MALKKTNLKRLASLSAIGAGAVALTADQAEASIIESPVLNYTVGFASGNPVALFPVANSSNVLFGVSATGCGCVARGSRTVYMFGLGGLRFGAYSSYGTTYLAFVSYGVDWNAISTTMSYASVGGRY